MARANEAIKSESARTGLPVGSTCLDGHQQYEALKALDFTWTGQHWEAIGPQGGRWYIGNDGKVISCGGKGAP